MQASLQDILEVVKAKKSHLSAKIDEFRQYC